MTWNERVPLMAQEGWLRYQEKAAKPPLKTQTGWSFSNEMFQDARQRLFED